MPGASPERLVQICGFLEHDATSQIQIPDYLHSFVWFVYIRSGIVQHRISNIGSVMIRCASQEFPFELVLECDISNIQDHAG